MTVPGTPRHTGPSRYCGRDFTPAELDVIAGLAAALPSRAEISRAVCDALGWHAPGGRRKDMTARVALNRMAADHLITLPPPRHGNGNGRHPRHAARGWRPATSVDSDHTRITGHRRNPDGDEVPEVRRRL